ncbi:MAG: tyrosine-type recombinase/integrase [Deferribacterales bacterium]
MEMRLFKRENGTWYIQFERGNKKSLKTKNKLEAQRIYNEYVKQAMDGKIVNLHNSEFLSEFKESCLDDIKATKSAAYHTSMTYSLDAFLDITGDKEISKLTKRDMAKFVEHRLASGKSKTTVNIDIRNVKSALSKAVEWELISKNPMHGYKQLRIDRKAPAFLTMEDIPKVADKIEHPVVKQAFYFYLLTGCRREEIISLTWKDIDLKNNRIHIKKTKTHLDRHIPINSNLKSMIESIEHRVGYLFPGRCKGKHINKDTMTHLIKKALTEAGFGHMRLHDLRHTFASLLAMNNIPLKAIGELLGHTDSRTTEIYAHLTKDYLENAVDTLDIKTND